MSEENPVSLWCTRIITWSFYLLFILVPLILTPINYELFEYNKMMLTYGLTVIIAVAWIIKMVREKELRIAKTPLDIPISLFVASQLISSIFSMDPHVSWFGYYSRFNGGMWSIISYVVLYYAFVTNFGVFAGQSSQESESGIMNHESWKKQKKSKFSPQFTPHNSLFTILRITLATAVVVSVYAVLERLGIDKKIWVQDVQNRVFSTLGQPNWLAAYVVALAPVAMVMAVTSQISKFKTQNTNQSQNSNLKSLLDFGFWIWNFVVILFFFVLLFTRSRSGLLGFAVADILVWLGLFITTRDKRVLWPTFALLHGLFVLIVFFNGANVDQIDKYTFSSIQNALSPKHAQQVTKPPTNAGPALETGGTESGTIRTYVWQAAVTAWRSSTKALLIGTGTETFAFAFYQYRPAAHNLTSEWDFLYNKAHNEYLNYLATTGAFGLGTYLIFIGVFIIWFLKIQISKHKSQSTFKIQNSNLDLGFGASFEIWILEFALFSGWISILITNFFGFSVVIMQIFLFLFPAMIFVQAAPSRWYGRKLTAKFPGSFITTGVVLVGIVLFAILAVRWYADTLYAKSYQVARSGQYAAAKPLIDEAIILNPGEPVYHDERATTLAALAVGALDQQQATMGGKLAQQALAENDRTLQISPQNVNFWKTRTKIYYSFSLYDPKFTQAAIEALTRAEQLSPNDPKILYNLAILNGRVVENGKAIDFLKKAIQLKSDYRDAYYALYVFYTELKDPTDARTTLETYLTTVNASDKQFTDLLGKTTR